MVSIGVLKHFNRFNDLLEMETTQPATSDELAMAGIGTRSTARTKAEH